MRFWTALQYPLNQAALICDGQIVKTIPPRPPNTPARWVVLVSQYDDCLVVGRRCSIELWDRGGTELIHSVYHPWIYSLHDCRQVGADLLLACATLDVVFKLDLQGQASWNWWAWRDGLAEKPGFIERDDWQTVQLTQHVEHNTAHLNSITLENDHTVLATLLRPRTIVQLNLSDHQPQSRFVESLKATDPHDFQYHAGRAVYGRRDGITIDGRAHDGYEYVKRIFPVGEDRYLFTHEEGITQIDCEGRRLIDWTLPRPFGITCLEVDSGSSIRAQATGQQPQKEATT